jgi:hypothetical protein
MNNSQFFILIATLTVVAMQDRVCADQQPPPQNRDTSAVAESISSNPGAVDVRTGTGELQGTIEGLLSLPKDTGFFLGGLAAADANWLATGLIFHSSLVSW